MKALLLAGATVIGGLAAPAFGQAMGHAMMPGMKMPAPSAPARPARRAKPAAKPVPAPKPAPRARVPARPIAAPTKPAASADRTCPPEHAAMGHCEPGAAPPAMDPAMPMPAAVQQPAVADPSCPPEHAAMGHCTPTTAPGAAAAKSGTDLSPGDAPAPAAPEPTYANRVWGRDAMASSRALFFREHGGGRFSQIMVNLAELQIRNGKDGYRWEGEGWFGGDVDRLVVKSEGTGAFGHGVDDAEVQGLYSRAVGPYFNLQAGVRHDFRPHARSYATIGVEGLAPYWLEVAGALFVSDRGDVLARVEGHYDQRITQRLILQPRAELNLSAQDVRDDMIGAGLSDVELGLRLRYEIAREFAPYVGVSWDRKVGATARFARDAGDDISSPSVVVGVRAWF